MDNAALMDKLRLTTGLGQRCALPTFPTSPYHNKKTFFSFFRGRNSKGPSLIAWPSHICGHRLLSLYRPSCLPLHSVSLQANRVSIFCIFAMRRKEGKNWGDTGTYYTAVVVFFTDSACAPLGPWVI